jgi:AbrB family looped-hinge helix DNA binding protein
MKNRAVVSERGTITIPGPVRKVAGIHPGDLIEFEPKKDKIILKHLIVKYPGEEPFMSDSEWDNFDRLVQTQMRKGQYTRYSDLDKARLHSRNLARKK